MAALETSRGVSVFHIPSAFSWHLLRCRRQVRGMSCLGRRFRRLAQKIVQTNSSKTCHRSNKPRYRYRDSSWFFKAFPWFRKCDRAPNLPRLLLNSTNSTLYIAKLSNPNFNYKRPFWEKPFSSWIVSRVLNKRGHQPNRSVYPVIPRVKTMDRIQSFFFCFEWFSQNWPRYFGSSHSYFRILHYCRRRYSKLDYGSLLR